MHNIFETLQYDPDLTIDEYNYVTKEVFLKHFKDETTFLKNKELLRTELVNYIKYIAKKEKFEQLFEKVLKVFNDAIAKDKNKVIKELALNLLKISKTDSLYLAYYIRQPKDFSSYSPREFAEYHFDVIYEILESCYKPRIELFYKIYTFDKDGVLPDTAGKNFGDTLNLINWFDELTKDPILNIVFSQWRNIATHKDFEIGKNSIKVEYGQKDNRKTKTLNHNQLKEITFYIHSVYNALRLAEVIIYLNYTEEIMATDEVKSIAFNIRSEASLLHIIHNIQTVGFEFHSLNDKKNIFILNLYIKKNNDLQESVIHASQVFTKLAMALDNDELQKDKFDEIQINILDKNDVVMASAKIDIKSCIDYSFGKINMNQLIENIAYKIESRGSQIENSVGSILEHTLN
ncbi:hypothetical protein CVO_05830 [Sulfurimonas sp. CVO]|uniref:hypothetical protein n=1 Tax=Sulfurimonas sp. CVO TaxID=2283483 RepID=UPI00132EC081|nr:hypothetical protein [Sulfurimonas sp. CVO]QHG91386.1 hypothetical protein CVO_05830 [Sulfurimonas sp. CVO]